MRKVQALPVVLIVLAACVATAGDAIEVRDAWSREVPGMSHTGGVFMVIENGGTNDDALVGATTDICQVVELHESILEGDMMKMQPVSGGAIDIPAGEVVELRPGGLHMMLAGLQERPVAGESFELTLEFERAGKIDVTVIVREPGAVGVGP